MLSPPYKITSTHLLLIHHLPVMHIFEDSNLKSCKYITKNIDLPKKLAWVTYICTIKPINMEKKLMGKCRPANAHGSNQLQDSRHLYIILGV
jgi:hypothetical protein